MNNAIEKDGIFPQIAVSIRIVLVTMVICCLLYPLVILGIGQALAPYTANGSLIRNEQGEIIGSEVHRAEFFPPRIFLAQAFGCGL